VIFKALNNQGSHQPKTASQAEAEAKAVLHEPERDNVFAESMIEQYGGTLRSAADIQKSTRAPREKAKRVAEDHMVDLLYGGWVLERVITYRKDGMTLDAAINRAMTELRQAEAAMAVDTADAKRPWILRVFVRFYRWIRRR
jgi:hypothetical protein